MNICDRCAQETDVTMTSPLDGKEICHACFEEEKEQYEQPEEVGVVRDPSGIGPLWRDGINYYR